MKYVEFVSEVVNIFFKKKRNKDISNRIKRGRSATSSAEIEDLLSKAIANAIPNNYQLLVDYPISYKPSKSQRTKTIYPDISIIKNKSLKGIIEFKIDLGYLPENWSLKNQNSFREMINAKSAYYKLGVGVPKQIPQILIIPKGLKRCVVILSAKNDHGHIAEFKRKNKPCYVLVSGKHPNSHEIEMKDKLSFIEELAQNSSGWNSFINYLIKTYK